MVSRAVLRLLAVLCTAGPVRANYSVPPGSPFLQPQPQPQPFQPYPRAYSSPGYLPPGAAPYREPERAYSPPYYSRPDASGEYYESDAASAAPPPAERGGYGYRPPAPPAPPAPPPPPAAPARPGTFTRVQGGQGRAQLHAVLDYDDDYYEDETDSGSPGNGDVGNGGHMQAATPIQGPIFLKNGTVPVVPLYSYPVLNNGSFVQIPILWSALSVALGLEVRGQLIRGVPCVKRFHQLYCPTAGHTYPVDRIEHFIDENKALMKRMYGDFTVFTEYGLPRRGRRAAPGVPDPLGPHEGGEGHSPFLRRARQAQGRVRPTAPPSTPPFLNPNQGNSSGRIDACESKMEIVTPYWALNSAGKVRAVVNTMHFEQAIHQEVCSKTQTNRCAGDCGCEQKYKWHRLLAYDPDQDCAGIFMDWFLFPSCCVCRCTP